MEKSILLFLQNKINSKTKTKIKIESDTLLSELGLNSLDIAELAFEIEDEFGIKIKVKSVNQFRTIKDIEDYFSNSSL